MLESRCALYVDAGYLLAAAATTAAGTSLRTGISVDYPRLVNTLVTHATEASGLPLLRVHWYDAARNRIADATQEMISLLPWVTLRLGHIGFEGEQKGVDLRIGIDMLLHAQNRVASVVYLVSGDGDLTEAVDEVKRLGVRVRVLAVPTESGTPHGVSRRLQAASDTLDVLPQDALAAVTPATAPPARPSNNTPTAANTTNTTNSVSGVDLSGLKPLRQGDQEPESLPARPIPTPLPPRNGSTGAGLVYSSATNTGTTVLVESTALGYDLAIDQVADRVLDTWMRSTTGDVNVLIANRPEIPRELDRALLVDLSHAVHDYDLDDQTRKKLRAVFWSKVAERSHR